MTYDARVNGETRRMEWTEEGERCTYAWGDERGVLDLREVEPGVYAVLAQGRSVTVTLGADGWAEAAGQTFQVTVTDPRNGGGGNGAASRSGQLKIAAPMPGRVVRVLVEPGQPVAEGQGLVVVEAMKMQNEMKAPRGATVAVVKTQDGATVSAGEVLVILD